MDKAWKFISYVFHPILMPTLGVAIIISIDPLLYSSVESDQFWLLLGSYASLTLLCTAIMPVFFSWILMKTERISSLTNPTDKDRLYLIAFTELCFILAYYSIRNIPVSGRSLSYFFLGMNISTIMTLIASMMTRVSLHAVGIGGILGTIIGLMYYTRVQSLPMAIVAIMLVYLVDFSRYKIKAHNAADIYLGNIIGIACQAATFMLLGK